MSLVDLKQIQFQQVCVLGRALALNFFLNSYFRVTEFLHSEIWGLIITWNLFCMSAVKIKHKMNFDLVHEMLIHASL